MADASGISDNFGGGSDVDSGGGGSSAVAPKRAPVIVVLGSVNIDLVAKVGRFPTAGETLAGESFFTAGGGKGANQAVAAARLGAVVRMVGKVGDDFFGRKLLGDLAAQGVDVANVGVDADSATGAAMIMVDAAGENRIVAVYGANMACGEEQLSAAKRAMDGADALMLQLETPPLISLAAARYARSRGLRVIWDPAPAAQMPDGAFAAADIVTPNQSEAEALTGIRVLDWDTARAAADALLAKGAGIAVVKLGEMGALAATSSECHRQPAFRVNAVDSVAAGDAFGAGLAVALSEGRALGDALRFAAGAGALAAAKRGAQDAMPWRGEVDALAAGAGGGG